MDSMMLQELLILALSIVTLCGGTACIARRDKRWNDQGGSGNGKSKRTRRAAKLAPQGNAA